MTNKASMSSHITGSGRVGTGRGGPWESVWCWVGSGGLETGGRIGGDSFENKSRVGFEKIIQSDRVCLGPKSFSRVFSSQRGFGPKIKGKHKKTQGFFRAPLGGPGTTRLTVDWPVRVSQANVENTTPWMLI